MNRAKTVWVYEGYAGHGNLPTVVLYDSEKEAKERMKRDVLQYANAGSWVGAKKAFEQSQHTSHKFVGVQLNHTKITWIVLPRIRKYTPISEHVTWHIGRYDIIFNGIVRLPAEMGQAGMIQIMENGKYLVTFYSRYGTSECFNRFKESDVETYLKPHEIKDDEFVDLCDMRERYLMKGEEV